MKIKKNDQVKIIAGKDKGKMGKVLKVFRDDEKIIVEGRNLVKKNVRPKKEGEKGQRVEIAGRMNISNAMMVCPKCGKATRIGFAKNGDKKSRICKKCKAEI